MQLTEEQIKLIGSCQFFDPRKNIDLANQLVAADEPLLALRVLDCVPGWYRDNPSVDIVKTKNAIHQKLATPAFYSKSDFDANLDVTKSVSALDGLLRGQLILKDVQDYNKEGKTPHIVDVGPGEYWLPIGLKEKGVQFTYESVGLCDKANNKAREMLGDVYQEKKDAPHKIYVACEIIEHLHYEGDLLVEMQRYAPDAEIVHFSTPKYTYDGRAERLDWEKYGDLGHLRTYTPKEFTDKILNMFIGFNFYFYDGIIMHLKGVRNGLSNRGSN